MGVSIGDTAAAAGLVGFTDGSTPNVGTEFTGRVCNGSGAGDGTAGTAAGTGIGIGAGAGPPYPLTGLGGLANPLFSDGCGGRGKLIGGGGVGSCLSVGIGGIFSPII